MTESPSWMDVEPSGIMISPPRATTATRIPGFRDRSRRGVPQMAGGGGDGKLHGLGGPIRDAVQSVHHAALGVLHPPDHLENVGGGQLLGGDDAVQTNGLGDTVVVLRLDLVMTLERPSWAAYREMMRLSSSRSVRATKASPGGEVL